MHILNALGAAGLAWWVNFLFMGFVLREINRLDMKWSNDKRVSLLFESGIIPALFAFLTFI